MLTVVMQTKITSSLHSYKTERSSKKVSIMKKLWKLWIVKHVRHIFLQPKNTSSYSLIYLTTVQNQQINSQKGDLFISQIHFLLNNLLTTIFFPL